MKKTLLTHFSRRAVVGLVLGYGISLCAAIPSAVGQEASGVFGSADPGPGRLGPPATAGAVMVGTARGIEVDGTMDEVPWSAATTVSLPWEVSPADNGPAPVATECRLAFDDDRFLVGCHARDPDLDAIQAYLTDRDGIRGHDRVVLVLDPLSGLFVGYGDDREGHVDPQGTRISLEPQRRAFFVKLGYGWRP